MKKGLVLAVAVFAFAFLTSASAHEHHAPHKGTLVEFGEEFAHLELVIDAATGKISAYVLDGEAEKAVRIAQKEIEIKVVKGEKNDAFSVTVKAQEVVLSGEKPGDSSEFSGESEKLKG